LRRGLGVGAAAGVIPFGFKGWSLQQVQLLVRTKPVLLGVKPRYQATISDRLQIFGKPVIRWDDVIPEPFV
jgi:hypothetical protein